MRRIAGRALIALGVLLAVAPLLIWATGALGPSTMLLLVAPSVLVVAAGAYAVVCVALIAGGAALLRRA